MNTTYTQRNLATVGTSIALLAVLIFGASTLTAHAASISSQLELGSKGQEVTDLQTYLATNASWYPSRLVTGYFGSLTQSGVQNFQSAQGIVSSGTAASTGYGRVGPATMNRLNQLMMTTETQSIANAAPLLSVFQVQPTQNSIIFSWTTNEPTNGQIYWSTSPFQTDEATGPGQTPYVGGNLASDASGMQTYHTVTVSNLASGTLYYYFMRSIDASGSMSVVLLSTIRTN